MKTLVIRGGAIGDFILTLPAISALRLGTVKRQTFEWPPIPRPLEILGYPAIARIAVDSGLADRAWPLEAPTLAAFFSENGVLNASQATFFSQFDLIISYLFDPQLIFERNVLRCTSARFIRAPHRPDEHSNKHATDVFLEPVHSLGIVSPPQTMLTFPENPQAQQHYAGFLAAHPGSGSKSKNWPEENWRQLLTWIVKTTQWNTLLIGGEAEEERVLRLAKALPENRVELALNFPLNELACRMRYCRGFIGHDSGITHLAAAVGMHGWALWGRTSKRIWHPQSPHIQILENADSLENLSVKTVSAAIIKTLET